MAKEKNEDENTQRQNDADISSLRVKAKYIRSYNKNGPVFVYAILGSKEHKQAYVDAVSRQTKMDGTPVTPAYEVEGDTDSAPLFFTKRFHEDTPNSGIITLGFRRDNMAPFMDTSAQQILISKVDQLGDTVLGRATARLAAEMILGVAPKQAATPAQASVIPASTPEAVDGSFDADM
jgi:hypothetical protein